MKADLELINAQSLYLIELLGLTFDRKISIIVALLVM